MSASFLSCGGDDDDGGSCSAFTPCGGDVVGTWTVKNVCATGSGAGLIEDCPGATTSFEGIKGSGTITFTANMTTMENINLTGSMKMTLPASCLMGATCAQIDTALKAALTSDPEAPFSAVSCSGSSGCTCTMTFKNSNLMETGTYSISGNRITDGDGEAQEYCVSGKTMNMRTVMSMGAMMEDLSMSMTLEKQ